MRTHRSKFCNFGAQLLIMKKLFVVFLLLVSAFTQAQQTVNFSATPTADSILHRAWLYTSNDYDMDWVNREMLRSYYQNQEDEFRFYVTVKKVEYLRRTAPDCVKGFVSTKGNDVKRLYNFIKNSCPTKAGLAMSFFDFDPINYKIEKSKTTGDSVLYKVVSEKGVSMPHEILLTQTSSKETGKVKTKRTLKIAPVENEYTVKAHENEKIIVDPKALLPDVNYLNNRPGTAVGYHFNPFIKPESQFTEYVVDWRPDLWYNSFDGFKVGGVVNGTYMNQLHNFTLRAFYNTGLEQEYLVPNDIRNDFDRINFVFDYDTYLAKGLRFRTDFRLLDGLQSSQAGLDYFLPNGKTEIYGFFRTMYRANEAALEYLFIPEWGVGQRNHKFHVGISHYYEYEKGSGMIDFELVSSSLGSDYDFSYLVFESKHEHRFGKLPIRYRFFGQYGTGTNWAPESRLFLAGANPEEYMDDPFTRSQGIINRSFAGDFDGNLNTFHYGGGLNLRGYNGYFAPYIAENGEVVSTYAGTTGASVNAELPFTALFLNRETSLDDLVNVEAYLFGDAGIINANAPGEDLVFSNFRADAGIGGNIEIKRFGKFNDLKPLTIRVDLPLFLNRPGPDDDYFAFRFLLGISKAF